MSLSLQRRIAVLVFVFACFSRLAVVNGQPLTITTFAGPGNSAGGTDDGIGSAARFFDPTGVATDSNGNVYVADSRSHTIRKITAAGAVTTLAGLAGSSGAADGIGSAARFRNPIGVATDTNGNVYVADAYNDTIRKITSKGVVTTLAGLAYNSGSVDGIGSEARFSRPSALAADRNGNVYVADESNSTVRKITPEGTVTTFAGLSGNRGSADGTGSAARFGTLSGVATDAGGNVYISDRDYQTIRKITPAGVVMTLAGRPANRGSADGTRDTARFSGPDGIATDGDGNVYVADTQNHKIRKVTASGVVTTLAGVAGFQGNDDGIGSGATFSYPYAVATDANGNVYVTDTYNHMIRKIAASGVVTTVAGDGGVYGGSVDGLSHAAHFRFPVGVATDDYGNVYVADTENHTIRKIDAGGEVTTLAGFAGSSGTADGTGIAARFALPRGVATDGSGNVYVADTFNNTIRKITSAGLVTTLAGLAGAIGSADGIASDARFNRPYGIATDSGGNVYVADTSNSTIRKITPAGIVTTLAGLAGMHGNDDGVGSAARFNRIGAVTSDSNGTLYVSSAASHTIRKISPMGAVTTLAGLADMFGSIDGAGTAARFTAPAGLAIDHSGNIYVTELTNTIRKITPDGVVTTVAGLADPFTGSGSADGTGQAARFFYPVGVATDNKGHVYIADSWNGAIRKGTPVLNDSATIDQTTGAVGVTRMLDTLGRTATSWEWRVTRQPADSTAALSSADIRNPTFTADMPDLYQFRLIARGDAGSSVTEVSLWVTTPQPPPRRRAVRR